MERWLSYLPWCTEQSVCNNKPSTFKVIKDVQETQIKNYHHIESIKCTKAQLFIHSLHSNVFLFVSLLNLHRCDLQRLHSNQVVSNGLQQHPSRSRSVPEGLAHVSTQPGIECHCSRNHWRSSSFRHPNRGVHVVEQITTSV